MNRGRALFVADLINLRDARTGHLAAFGASGTGKTALLSNLCCIRLDDPAWGLWVIDVEGDISPVCLEHAADPKRGLQWRTIHHLRPASGDWCFAVPLLHVERSEPSLCCQAAVRALSVFEQFLSFGMGEYGPRLSKLFLLAAYGLAMRGLPLIDMPTLFSVGSEDFRAQIAESYPYEFMSDELRALDVLQPRSYLEYRDALASRLLPIFSNPILRRVYGPQKPLDIARMLRNRDAVFLDLSGLEHRVSVLVGTSLVSVLFHHALQRQPNVEPHATLLIDEATDFVTPDLARAFDRLRKRNVQLVLACQRLGSLQ